MIIRSKAPLRISFGGGGSEVEPYLSEHGGAVINATIDRYAYGSLELRDDRNITITSLDYDTVAKFRLDEPLIYDGNLDLVKAVIKRLAINKNDQGLSIFLHSDAPPGSGLGASSTVVVTLIGIFARWLNLPLTNYEVADLAFKIERQDLGIEGGKQDQYAAVFGGFNFIEFTKDTTIVNPLRVPRDVLNELHHNLLICYTGKSRMSANIIKTQVDRYSQMNKDMVGYLNAIKELAFAQKNALLRGCLDEFGSLLDKSWAIKRKLADQISDASIDELYEAARTAGALGGKISGAGGGGHMFFYCPYDKKHIIAEKLESMGAEVVPFNFDFDGLQTWRLK